jgi:ABC-type transport system substrate-binding protein
MERRRSQLFPTRGRAALVFCGLLTIVTSACTPTSTGGLVDSSPPSGGMLRVVMPTWIGSELLDPAPPRADALDPQVNTWLDSAELFRCCLLRTLFSYAGRSAREGGAELHPDLALKLPEVSTDGLTWTFRIRPGIKYAPPMQRTEITAADFIRALQREARVPKGQTWVYSVIEGFDQYRDGKASTIAGLEAPDRYTLRVHLSEVAGDLADRFTLSNSAPIPPDPTEPGASYGAATGHDLGYGRFLIASGPYMIKGSPQLDFTVAPDRQQPVTGFTPGASLTLVRNPSWNRSTDPLRPAYLDEIRLSIGMSRDDAASLWESGQADLIWLPSPPLQVQSSLIKKVQSRQVMGRIQVESRDVSRFISMNLAVPPFDDIHVRKAVNYVIDKRGLSDAYGGDLAAQIATHIAPDSLENEALAGYDPYFTPGNGGSLELARQEMKQSRYDLNHDGTCSAPECKHLLALAINSVRNDGGPKFVQMGSIIADNLSQIGIILDLKIPDGTLPNPYTYPNLKLPLALTFGGFKSYMSASSIFVPGFSRPAAGGNHSLVGATPDQLHQWGYSVSSVPGVDDRIHECSLGGERQARCWSELDMYLMEKVVPIAPYAEENVIQVIPPRVVKYSFDQFANSPAFDQIAVAAS